MIGWELKANLTPNASHTKIGDIIIDAEGQPYIRMYVTAEPEDNKANKALLDLLSKAFSVPKNFISFLDIQIVERLCCLSVTYVLSLV